MLRGFEATTKVYVSWFFKLKSTNKGTSKSFSGDKTQCEAWLSHLEAKQASYD